MTRTPAIRTLARLAKGTRTVRPARVRPCTNDERLERHPCCGKPRSEVASCVHRLGGGDGRCADHERQAPGCQHEREQDRASLRQIASARLRPGHETATSGRSSRHHRYLSHRRPRRRGLGSRAFQLKDSSSCLVRSLCATPLPPHAPSMSRWKPYEGVIVAPEACHDCQGSCYV